MREFEATIKGDVIRQGLRKSYRNSRNNYGLVQCKNFKVVEQGLAVYEELPFAISEGQLLTAAVELAWPEPRIIQGKHNTFMTYGTRLFLVNEDGWLLYELTDIRDVDNSNNQIEIQDGGNWELVDMHNTWLLTNGMSSVMYNRVGNIHAGTDLVRGQNFARIRTGCEHRGRMLLGGFDKENFWHSTWKAFFDDWGKRLASNFNTTMDMEENFVMWSGVGLDLFWLFFPGQGTAGYQTGSGFGAGRPKIFEDMLRNDMGWMPMPWRGSVVNMRAMENSVVVYGTGGVSALFLAEDTYGRRDLSTLYGINNQGAVGGDEKIQVFLDSYGELCLLEVGQGGVPKDVQKLGYREFFIDSLDTSWQINYDPHEKEFYICNGLETFILTEYGLSTCGQLVSGVAFRDETLMCLGSELLDRDVLLVTDEFDNGRSEYDTLEWIKIGGNKSFDYQIAVDVKFEANEDWTRSEWFDPNVNGAVRIGYAGMSFRIALRSNGLGDPSEVEPPDWITYTFKTSDKRYTRGINIANIASS